MEIEIICTGDEILTGKTINSNFTWMTQKLEDYGLSVMRGVTVGDDREELLRAFLDAGSRADVVIVNGGLGPTVDDLSQEIAAQAAGVPLELNQVWLERLEAMFGARGRTLTENNRKQALLPAGAELVNNPVGTACGFGVDIGKARFYFTPGVPREMFRMVEDELLPRILAKSGDRDFIKLKRFHSYGLGESHVDEMLQGIEDLSPAGTVKLGFRTHYPQLETKLLVRATDESEVERQLAPVVDALRERMGNFIMSEDDETVESVISSLLTEQGATLALVEDFTGGQVAARLTLLAEAASYLKQAVVLLTAEARGRAFASSVDGEPLPPDGMALAQALASRARAGTDASFGLACVCDLEADDSPGSTEVAAISIAIDTADGLATREARLAGAREWIRRGAVEMTLDCLRRYLQGRPVAEKNDFER